MEFRFVPLLISVVVGVLLCATMLFPIISDATTTEKTFTNDGYFYMQKITSEDEGTYTLTYSYDPVALKPTFTYNGNEIDYTTAFPNILNYTVATDGESWVIRAGQSEYVGLQGIGDSFTFGGHNSRTANITFESGTVTVTRTIYQEATDTVVAGSTVTTTYDELWLYSDTPTNYVMKVSDKSAYLLDTSEYIAVGVTTVTAWNTVISLSGNPDDFTAEIIYPPNITTTVTNKAIDETQVSGYKDLHALNKLTFSINDGTTTVNATYSYFIVPAEVTAELSQHLNDTERTLVGIIPLLVIVGLVIGVVGVLYMRRE